MFFPDSWSTVRGLYDVYSTPEHRLDALASGMRMLQQPPEIAEHIAVPDADIFSLRDAVLDAGGDVKTVFEWLKVCETLILVLLSKPSAERFDREDRLLLRRGPDDNAYTVLERIVRAGKDSAVILMTALMELPIPDDVTDDQARAVGAVIENTLSPVCKEIGVKFGLLIDLVPKLTRLQRERYIHHPFTCALNVISLLTLDDKCERRKPQTLNELYFKAACRGAINFYQFHEGEFLLMCNLGLRRILAAPEADASEPEQDALVTAFTEKVLAMTPGARCRLVPSELLPAGYEWVDEVWANKRAALNSIFDYPRALKTLIDKTLIDQI